MKAVQFRIPKVIRMHYFSFQFSSKIDCKQISLLCCSSAWFHNGVKYFLCQSILIFMLYFHETVPQFVVYYFMNLLHKSLVLWAAEPGQHYCLTISEVHYCSEYIYGHWVVIILPEPVHYILHIPQSKPNFTHIYVVLV